MDDSLIYMEIPIKAENEVQKSIQSNIEVSPRWELFFATAFYRFTP